jgi:transcription-repair coupling factor (superfamily II helicase)
LLSKDVSFAILGLLVVDEEQRFGVRHKERIKQLKHNVDVLTMSATPIPRTLHMSLAGIARHVGDRDAAQGSAGDPHRGGALRQRADRTAIEQEIAAAARCISSTIAWTASTCARRHSGAAAGVRVGVGHGQMGEAELERVLLGFMQHEYDVFVCTTIAENGLDIPLANTMIIENAERHGLSELYQLRGRVGRSNREPMRICWFRPTPS